MADLNQNATKGVEANCYARMAQKRQNAKKVSVMVQDTVNMKNSDGNVLTAKEHHFASTKETDIIVLNAKVLGYANIIGEKGGVMNAVIHQRNIVLMDVNDVNVSHVVVHWFVSTKIVHMLLKQRVSNAKHAIHLLSDYQVPQKR